jgi:hypothetical protein
MSKKKPTLNQEEVPVIPTQLIDGRDELNLAEFPLGTLADRTAPNQKTLVFEDKIWDESIQRLVTRQLTITASDKYGLPTATDDEVILGLVQLTKLQKFKERKVYFSRYQLIQLLNWRNEGRSYERLTESLNRWIGVTFYYKNAWRDPETKQWVDRSFHILDNVNIYHQENNKTRPKPDTEQARFPFVSSSFTWNEVLFGSFTQGHLKALNFDFVIHLKSAVSKRLFRFLDKRFHKRNTLKMDVKALALEHIGLSRKSPIGEIKRRLGVAITELEEKGYLVPMCSSERFKKIRVGEWQVYFQKSDSNIAPPQTSDDLFSISTEERVLHPIVADLVGRGVGEKTAVELYTAYPQKQMETQLKVFDWLVSKKDKRISKNPAGYLVTSIRDSYTVPKEYIEFLSRIPKKRKKGAKKSAPKRRTSTETKKEKAIKAFWASLPAKDRASAEMEALAQADHMQKNWMKDPESDLAKSVRKNLMDQFALEHMRE